MGELVALGRRIMAVGAEERAKAMREGYKVRDTLTSAEVKVGLEDQRQKRGAYIAARGVGISEAKTKTPRS